MYLPSSALVGGYFTTAPPGKPTWDSCPIPRSILIYANLIFKYFILLVLNWENWRQLKVKKKKKFLNKKPEEGGVPKMAE